jgi:hypothetical protein
MHTGVGYRRPHGADGDFDRSQQAQLFSRDEWPG